MFNYVLMFTNCFVPFCDHLVGVIQQECNQRTRVHMKELYKCEQIHSKIVNNVVR